VRIGDIVDLLVKRLDLTEEEWTEMLPSGKQTRFANRVHWAKSYLKQAGLVQPTKRGYFIITERGRAALRDAHSSIDKHYLERFDEFKDFQNRTHDEEREAAGVSYETETTATPDELLREAHQKINAALAADLLDRVRLASPNFFEHLIVELLLAMGYGGTSEAAGRSLGKSGDDGVDGVIDQDPLGVDQIYTQAKRYAVANIVGPAAIRDFFGALGPKKAHKGIFVTTSSFSQTATDTARSRIVLIDGEQLAKLMIRYNVGCRDEDVLHVKRLDEDFFD
jgi:restriction system protein